MAKVVIGSNEYNVSPLSVGRALRVLSVVSKYASKSGTVLRAVAKQYPDEEMAARAARGIQEAAFMVSELEFEEDVLRLLGVLLDREPSEVAHIDTLELVEALPSVIKASRIEDLLRSAWSRIEAEVYKNRPAVVPAPEADPAEVE